MTSYQARIIAIVPAGGVGMRAGTAFPKQYRLLLGQPMLRWAVSALLADARIEQVRVAVASDDARAAGALHGLPRTVCRPCGGDTRAATVLSALHDAALGSEDWVLVHDAARPGLPADALARLIDTCLQQGEGGLLAEPVADTVKRAVQGEAGQQRVQTSVRREGLWLAQTPQMFPAGALLQALEAAIAPRPVTGEVAETGGITDEASAMELSGYHPLLVPGSMRNFKVTWPEHFEWMERLLQSGDQDGR